MGNLPDLQHANRHAPAGADSLGAYYIGQPATAATDGQLYGYSSTLLGTTAVNQAGNTELAYAENVTGTPTTLASGGSADIPGCAISVPASTRPVWLSARVHFKPTAAGVGLMQLQLLETTGTTTLIAYSGASLHGETPTAVEQLGYPVELRVRLGTTASTRTFKLLGALFADSGTPTCTVLNATTTPSYVMAEQK